MNRDVLTNDVSVADLDPAARVGVEAQILRKTADDRAVPDKITRAEPDRAFDHGLRLHHRAGADFHLIADAGIGAHFHLLGQSRTGTNERGRMNVHSRPVSLKLKYGSIRPSAGAPM